MKATLKFNLDDPDDKMNHLRCAKATDMALLLWDFDQWLRGEIKYNQKEHFQEARDELYEQMGNYGINLDELLT